MTEKRGENGWKERVVGVIWQWYGTGRLVQSGNDRKKVKTGEENRTGKERKGELFFA